MQYLALEIIEDYWRRFFNVVFVDLLQDHMMKWHFSGRIETIIPVTGKKPFSCPHCPFLGKDRQCVVRHYTGKYSISTYNCFGSGSAWIHLCFWSDASGSRNAKITHKNRKRSNFEVLDVHFWGLKASQLGHPLWRPRDKKMAIFDEKNINFFWP